MRRALPVKRSRGEPVLYSNLNQPVLYGYSTGKGEYALDDGNGTLIV